MADVAAAGLVGAVRAVDLEIRQGEISSSWACRVRKSTLVRCMSRLVEPTHGKVEFEGKDLLKISDAALIELRRHRMGMVFQNFALLPHLNVLRTSPSRSASRAGQADTRGAGARGHRSRRPARPRAFLSARIVRRPAAACRHRPQPGDKRRSVPRRAVLALDPLIRREMQDELMRLQTMLHKTIVFITHDFDEAIRWPTASPS